MFKKILIPLDLTDKQSTEVIFSPALNFVNAFNARIHLLHVIPDFGLKIVEDYLPKGWKSNQKEKSEKLLQDVIKRYIPEEIAVKTHIGYGAVYDQVITYAAKIEADLIIVSAVRPQLKDYMLGPNASKIVRHSKISVLVVR
jgi:nucleotide-binding universal stress UspA family protein